MPSPVYCPGLSGEVDAQVTAVIDNLPGHVCERAARQLEFGKRHEGGALALSTPARATGNAGLPISRRRLRNATEPISAGSHSEIAR